eukprot:TRINITY_DN30990_c0_g1_i2.p1 TRINITY_DN30990_c0_g1~~TRINITY_DN30990_c0_g1_i2.p1  ORF type:complete len:349 (+),score=78.70 TRINITY_DN30990_c0_g1_i2:888-1934(+)
MEAGPVRPGRATAQVTFMARADAEQAHSRVRPAHIRSARIEWSWDPPEPNPATPHYVAFSAENWYSELANLPPSAKRVSVDPGALAPQLRRLVDATAEAVARHGAGLERAIAEREESNPTYAFLRDSTGDARNYYLWRVFSLAQGDTLQHWRETPFQMFLGGAVWEPPPCPAAWGAPAVAAGAAGGGEAPAGGVVRDLAPEEREELFGILRGLGATRREICAAMLWCMDRAGAAADISAVLADALSLQQTAWSMRVARVMLVNDLLYNSACTAPGASLFRAHMQRMLPGVFAHLRDALRREAAGDSALAEQLSRPLHRVLSAWKSWNLYPDEFVAALRITLEAGVMPP